MPIDYGQLTCGPRATPALGYSPQIHRFIGTADISDDSWYQQYGYWWLCTSSNAVNCVARGMPAAFNSICILEDRMSVGQYIVQIRRYGAKVAQFRTSSSLYHTMFTAHAVWRML